MYIEDHIRKPKPKPKNPLVGGGSKDRRPLRETPPTSQKEQKNVPEKEAKRKHT